MVTREDLRIRHSFSVAAHGYDAFASLHREIGNALVGRICADAPAGPVLDVGVGTGWLTREIRRRCPGVTVVGIDSAAGMIQSSRDKSPDGLLARADACHLPLRPDSFERVTSNLAYQWVNDLPVAFRECRRILRDQGRLDITVFGHDTLTELFDVLSRARHASHGSALIFRRLPRPETLRAAVELAGFQKVIIKEERIRVSYLDLRELIKWVRGIGANALNPEFFLGKELWRRAEAEYQRCYRDPAGVRATFQVVWLHACK